MRLAIIRQRYTPQGGAERFLEGALEALLERNVAITLYTREWPQTHLQLIEPHICDPYYVGPLWRDWGFARAVAREIAGARVNLVQSHERLTTCDVYRPPDGVHAAWLEERLRDAPATLRWRVAVDPWHRYTLATERRLFASPWLRAVLCNSKMVRDDIKARFGLPDERLPVLYNGVDSNVYSPALAAHRERIRAKYRVPADAMLFLLVGSGFTRKGVPIRMARGWSVPIGFSGGALSAMFGTGGVLFAMYFTGRIRDKDELRATNASMIMFSALVRVVLFGMTGLLTQDSLLACAALLVPAMLAGFFVGNRLHAVISATRVVNLVYGVLVVAGVSLIYRGGA